MQPASLPGSGGAAGSDKQLAQLSLAQRLPDRRERQAVAGAERPKAATTLPEGGREVDHGREGGRVGLALRGGDARDTLDLIVQAERAGVAAAWLTTGGAGPDGITVLAAAAAVTSRIRLGTAIVPTYPRHPLALAQQTLVVCALAPGRFTLGVGPSHRPTIEGMFGLDMGQPLEHLREYVTVLKGALAGRVDFDGAYYRVHAQVALPAGGTAAAGGSNQLAPVMISALRRNAFRLAGEVADGAISWLCPPAYLRETALPALQAGAEGAGRPVPPLVAHTIIARSTDGAAVRRAAREQFALYPRLPFYQRMFADAGFAAALQGEFSDAMADTLVIWGDDAAIAARVRALLDLGDVHVLASPLPLTGMTPGDAARGMFDLIARL